MTQTPFDYGFAIQWDWVAEIEGKQPQIVESEDVVGLRLPPVRRILDQGLISGNKGMKRGDSCFGGSSAVPCWPAMSDSDHSIYGVTTTYKVEVLSCLRDGR